MDTRKMNVLVTIPDGYLKEKFLTYETKRILEERFSVKYNKTGRQYTQEELKDEIDGIDIVITGWGTPSFIRTKALQENDSVKMIAHTAGSIGDLLDDSAYQKGIKVVSGNRIFARSVAEGTLAYILSGLRSIPDIICSMRSNTKWIKSSDVDSKRLFGKTVGIIGYGMISRDLVRLLKPFGVKVKIFSNYPMDVSFLESMNAEPANMEEVFSECSVISLHSALNRKTKGMIGKEHFELMKPGTLFINTARGAIVRQDEMIKYFAEHPENKAFLDVYTVEPLEADSLLRSLPNVYTMPHQGGPTRDLYPVIGREVVGDVLRFADGKPLQYEISREHASVMTTNNI